MKKPIVALKKPNVLPIFVLVLLLALAACQPVTGPQVTGVAPTETVPPTVVQAPATGALATATAAPTETATLVPTETQAPTETAAPSPTATEAVVETPTATIAAQATATTPAQPGATATQPAATRPAATATQQAGGLPTRASLLRGDDVVDRDGDDLGEVEDLILGPEGVNQYVVVDTGQTLVPVPIQAFTIDQEEDELTFTLNVSVFDRAPDFENLDDIEPVDLSTDSNLFEFWSEYFDLAEEDVDDDQVLRPSTGGLAGTTVVDEDGNELGEIEEVLLDPDDEQAWLVLDVGDAFIPIPRVGFTYESDQDVLVFEEDPDVLDDAPSYPNLRAFEDLDADEVEEWEDFWF